MAYQTILITGANRGVGLEMVKQFAAMSPKAILATCRNPEAAEELQAVAKSNPIVHVLKLDVTDHASFGSIADQVKTVVGAHGLNLLINNAGIYLRATLGSVKAEDMVKSFEVNAVSPLLITQALLPLLRQSSSAGNKTAVINVTSKMGSIDDNGSGGHYAYRCSKVALNMVSKSLSVDLGKDNIACISLHPGWVKTDMGGSEGLLTATESVSHMITTILTLKPENYGRMLNYNGEIIPW